MLKSSTEISTELIAMIQELASCFFVPKEIALMTEIDEVLFMQLCNDSESEVHRAFNKGWLQSEFDLRKCIMKLAISGSSPAQTQALEIRNKAKLKLLD
jgi:hypothetical protein